MHSTSGNRKSFDDPEWYKPWEHLGPFSLNVAMISFVRELEPCLVWHTLSCIELYGDGFCSEMGHVSPDFSSLAFSNQFLQYPLGFHSSR